MRKISLMLLSFSMIGFWVEAEPRCERDAFLDRLSASADVVIVNDNAENSDHLLFIDLAHADLRPGDELVAEFVTGGRPYATESLEILEAGSVQAVELLSQNPDLVRDLLRSPDAKVTLRQGETVIEQISVSDAIRRSEQFRQQGGQPHVVRSMVATRPVDHAPWGVRAPAPRSGTVTRAVSGSCQYQCEDERILCQEQRCDYSPCAGCDALYDDCIRWTCGICEPSSRTETTTQLLSVVKNYNFAACFRRPPHYSSADWVVWSRFNYKQTKKRIDTHEDCSVTETILSVTYPYYDCWLWDQPFCSQNVQYPFNLCSG